MTYYTPSEIRFTRDEILWVIQYVLPVPDWPSEAVESGYTDTPIQTSPSCHASFEARSQIVSEVYYRLFECGSDGMALVDEVWNLEDEATIDMLSWNSRQALNFISGWCRRSNSCANCLSKECKKRGREPVTYAVWLSKRKAQSKWRLSTTPLTTVPEKSKLIGN
jgi:hypothetical protein